MVLYELCFSVAFVLQLWCDIRDKCPRDPILFRAFRDGMDCIVSHVVTQGKLKL